MPNVPEVVPAGINSEEAQAYAEAAEAAAIAATEGSEAAESARATAEAEAISATEAAAAAEEGGYPAGKEAAEVVTAPATEPEVPGEEGEGTVTLGEPGVVRSVKVVFVGDGEKTAWKVKHELNTDVTSTTFHSESEELAGIQTLVKESKRLSAEEIEVVLETAPAEAETFWLIVQG